MESSQFFIIRSNPHKWIVHVQIVENIFYDSVDNHVSCTFICLWGYKNTLNQSFDLKIGDSLSMALHEYI